MKSKAKLDVAVVGTGAVATKIHIPCLLRNEDVLIKAVVDVDYEKAKKVARKFGIQHFYPSIDELLNSTSIDAVNICTPPNSHAQIAIEALESGVDVLCEKPLADNIKNGLAMVQAAEKSERTLMVGLNRRFHENYLRAKHFAQTGRMGKVYLAEYWSLQRSPLIGWSKSPWFYRAGTGGVLLDQASHVFDMLNWFLGKPKSIIISKGAFSDSSVEEFCLAVVGYEDGKTGVGGMSWLSSVTFEKLGIHGSGRTMYACPSTLMDVNKTDTLEISLLKSATFAATSKLKTYFKGETNTHQLEIDHFIDCVRKGKKPVIDGQDGLEAMVLTEAALNSLQNGEKVSIS